MNASTQRRLGIVLGYLNIGVGALISLAYTPYMLRVLGKSEFGLFTLANSVVGYLTLLSFGLSGSYLRFCTKHLVSKDRKGLAELNGIYLVVNLFLSALAMAVGGIIVVGAKYFFASSLSPQEIALTQKLLMVLIVNTAITFPMSIFSSYLIAYENFLVSKVINLLRTICSPLLVIAALLTGYRSIGMVVATTVVMILSELLNLFWCVRKLDFKISFGRLEPQAFREILGFSAFVFVQAIADQLNWSVDSVVLTKMLGAAAAAVYGLGSQLNTYMRQFALVISSVYSPKANQMVAEGRSKRELTDFYLSVSSKQFVLVFLIISGFVLCGRYFMELWGGPGYEQSYFIAVVLLLAVAPSMFLSVGIDIRRAMNLHQKPAVMILAAAVLNVVITIPLVYWMGAVGAAVGTLISFTASLAYQLWHYDRVMGLEMGRFWKGIAALSVAPCLCFALGLLAVRQYPVRSLPAFCIAVPAYTLLYAAGLLVQHKVKQKFRKKM